MLVDERVAHGPQEATNERPRSAKVPLRNHQRATKAFISHAFATPNASFVSCPFSCFISHMSQFSFHMSWYMCLSIFLACRYLRKRRRNTRCRRTHNILDGMRASYVPRFLLCRLRCRLHCAASSWNLGSGAALLVSATPLRRT